MILFRVVTTLMIFASVLSGSIISSTGSVKLVAAPPNVMVGQYESDSYARVFDEQQGVTLLSALKVDFNAPGTYSTPPLAYPLIPAGTVINSYYMVVDAKTVNVQTPRRYTGSITFSTPILGVIVLNPEFAASNAVLGLPGTKYSSTQINYELNTPTEDALQLSADMRTVSFNVLTSIAADNMRIITAATFLPPTPTPNIPPVAQIPEPGTMAMVGLGLGAVAVRGWRRRRT